MLEKEVIFKDDLEKIFGKRPFDKEEQPELNGAENSSTTTKEEEKAQEESESKGAEEEHK